MLQKIHRFFLNASFPIFTSTLLLIKIMWSSLISGISEALEIDAYKMNDALVFESLADEFWTVVVFGPLVETFLFQHLVFLVLDYFKLPKKWIILISALLFAVTHDYSIIYIIHAFVGGLLFAYIYFICQIKYRSAFWVVFLLHALYNLYGFLVIHHYIPSL